jgi:parallel beta-helix repeat protein
LYSKGLPFSFQQIYINSSYQFPDTSGTLITNALVGLKVKNPGPDELLIENSTFISNVHHVIVIGPYYDPDPDAICQRSTYIRNNQFFKNTCQHSLSCTSILPSNGWVPDCGMVSIGPSSSRPNPCGVEVKQNVFDYKLRAVASKRSTGQSSHSGPHPLGLVLHQLTIQDDGYPSIVHDNNYYLGDPYDVGLKITNSEYVEIYNEEMELGGQGTLTGMLLKNSRGLNVDTNTIANETNNQQVGYGIKIEYDGSGKTTEALGIENNTISEANHGIYLDEVRDSYFGNNTVTNCDHGIEYYADQNYTNATVIRENKITGGTSGNKTGHGIVVAPEVDPRNNNTSANSSSNTINLEIRCNKIWYNELGIVGSGNLKDQISSTQPAGNMFDDPNTSNSRNKNWDILWRNRHGSDLTYHYQANKYDPNSAGNLSPSEEFINGQKTGGNGISNELITNAIPYTGCYGTWKRNPTNTENNKYEEDEAGLKVYPNPFSKELQISTKGIQEGQMVVTNMKGQSVIQRDFAGGNLTLTTKSWQPGAYMVELIAQNGKVYTRKLLKVNH